MSHMQQVFGKALLGAALALSVALPLGAAAKGMPTDVIYNFTGGSDGGVPQAGLIRDAAGNFYGTTGQGGDASCTYGCGVVFKLSPLGVETVLHAFKGGNEGRIPIGRLTADAAGNLYGTTYLGGAQNGGAVFKLTPGGVETVLHAFAGGSDGRYPRAGLAMDGAGNLYGATYGGGGPSDLGTIFKVAPDGTETILHAFTGGRDGSRPLVDLIVDKKGAVYGTSDNGGLHGQGVIYKIAAGGNFSVLYSFTGGADGSGPGDLIMDSQGVLYGSTGSGGGSCNCGVAYKLAPDGTETVLHTFTGAPGAAYPSISAMDKAGNLFGLADGGSFNEGSIFQISPDGTETVLHSFAFRHDSPPDGVFPNGNLTLYMNKVYGVTQDGGTSAARCDSPYHLCGTVFEVRRAK